MLLPTTHSSSCSEGAVGLPLPACSSTASSTASLLPSECKVSLLTSLPPLQPLLRQTELPGETELAVARTWLLLCLRCGSSSTRNKAGVMLTKLLTRLRVSVHSHLRKHYHPSPAARAATKRSKAAASQPQLPAPAEQAPGGPDGLAPVRRQQEFMQWLTRTLLGSVYPGAPYARKNFALELLNGVMDCWQQEGAWVASPLCALGAEAAAAGTGAAGARAAGEQGMRGDPAAKFGFQPFCEGFVSAETTQLLLSAVGNSWDRLRAGSMSVLARMPTPLPGLETPELVLPLARWAAGSCAQPLHCHKQLHITAVPLPVLHHGGYE